MNKRLKFSFILCFVMHFLIGFSQESQTIHSNASIAEKIYLQLDKDIYTTGSTIWFKAIVTKAFDNAPTNLSGILYVELINAEETLIEKKMIKLNNGIGKGFFDLPETFLAGAYLIRAYTEWNKNFDTDFFFEKYIQVFSLRNSIANDKKEALQTKISEENHLEIHSPIDNIIDLQFLPESGELVHGLSSNIGFKALNSFGTSIPVEGVVFDNDNNQITTFKSNALGMGSFLLDSVNGNRTYHAKLNNESKIYPLPKVASLGNVISVSEKDKIITVNTASNYLKNDTISLNVSFRGAILHNFKAKLKNGNLKFIFSSNELPEGILVFKMIDNFNRTLAERLYFNKRLETNLNLNLSTNKSIYSKRELTNLHIETVNKNGEPVNANASVLIINKQELGGLQNTRDNIFTYFLVSSELKGEIENPGYYFNSNTPPSDLDALLLTQGWRHYKYDKPFDKLNFKPETSLTVSGKATIKQSNNKSNEVDLTMVTYGKGEVLYMQTTDTLGYFKFDLDDEFGDHVKVLIAAKQSGKKVDTKFIIDEKKSPIIEFQKKTTLEKLDTTTEIFVEKAIENKKTETNFFIPSENIALDEVVVTGRKLSPIQQKVIDRFGEPDKIIEGTELREKEKSWSSGIYDILHYNFYDKVRILRDSVGGLRIQAINNQLTLVVVDGIPVQLYEYGQLQNIPANEVTSVEVIEYAKFFKTFCIKVYSPLGRESECSEPRKGHQGNIVAIYTKAGKGIHGAYTVKSKSLGETTIPVFSESKTFYAPKYDITLPEELDRPDLRTLIHWQPILQTEDSGIAKTSFYNGDITGDMMVIVEAITEDGTVAYEELTYKVE